MNEFIFGTLATTEQRLETAREEKIGVQHQHRLEPRAPRPGQSPTLLVTVELDRRIERVDCVVSEPTTAVYPLHHHDSQWDLLNWSYYQVWQVDLPPQPDGTLVRYQIVAYPADGGDPMLADDGATFSYFVGNPAQPDWAREAIVYQIFPDRFYPGDGRSWHETHSLSDIYGGTLRGIIDKLDYVADLGFNAIWLNPFFPDQTHHGYHASDYFSVNPRLGTLDDLKELVSAAHERGIRLILDFVANHWGSAHDTFQAALADRTSAYYHWYKWENWPHAYATFFGVKDLPEINVQHPDVRAYLLNSVRYWLGEIGFDGLRLDYVLGPTHDFWTELRAVAKSVRPDVWIFGEAVETPVTQLSYEGRFDGCLDFLLTQAIRRTFAFGTMDVEAFATFLDLHEDFFPASFSRPSFLDNHDMNRFLWLVGNDKRKLKLAALCQFTLAGAPIVYNGTEVGLTQERGITDPNSHGMEECRQPMLWGDEQDKDLLAFYRWLIDLRRQHPALWQGARRTLHADKVTGTLAYVRHDEPEAVLVGLNASAEAQMIEFDWPRNGQSKRIELAPWSGTVIVIDE
jgi:cyclomaltodextrinase / maltogenic alpha-amylase / neopullulanase